MNGWTRKDDGRWIVPPKYERVVDVVVFALTIATIAYLGVHVAIAHAAGRI